MELGLHLPELAAETQLAVKQTPQCGDKTAFAFNLTVLESISSAELRPIRAGS